VQGHLELAKEKPQGVSTAPQGEIAMGSYLPKLRQLIKTARIEQAREPLSILGSRPDSERLEVIEMLARAPDQTALSLLSFLLGETNFSPDTREHLFQLTTDRAHLNFAFAKILLDYGDRSQLIQLSPLFKHILSNETDEALLISIIVTVGKLKLDILIDDVAEFIFYDHMGLKSDAIMALEQIGTISALEKLRQVALTDKCDGQILDAIDRLTPHQPEPLLTEPQPVATSTDKIKLQDKKNAYTKNLTLLASDTMENRYQAVDYFASRGPRVAQALAASITHQEALNHDLVVNLLELTAKTIPQEAIKSLFAILSSKKINPQIQFAVYNALAAFPALEPDAGAIKGVSHPSMYVRMAAINVLKRHCSDYIVAEIKNKIESGTKAGEVLVQSILDARATNLMEALMISDTFCYICSNYIDKNASLPVIESFLKVLEKRNQKSTAQKFSHIRDQRAGLEQAPFILISSSQAYLDVYTKLIHSCGHGTQNFTLTQEAFEAILSEKPVAIVCDLFLNDMTGLNFAREIREIYSQEELPIIISSLQKNLSKTRLDVELKRAKVNLYCNFPATLSQIKSWIKTP
jgi:CheY-like chemotaxis protein/HEAT repeat protein